MEIILVARGTARKTVNSMKLVGESESEVYIDDLGVIPRRFDLPCQSGF